METSQDRQSSKLQMPIAKKLRQWFVPIHRWLGLVLGIFIAIMGLTGSAIVFMHELDRTLNPGLMQVEAQGQIQPLDAIVASVVRSHPNLQVDWIKLPQKGDEPVMVAMKTLSGQRLETYIDPHTATVLGERIWERSIVGLMHTLHHDLLLGNVGLYAVGAIGIGFVLVSCTGILLWSGWRRLKSGGTVRWHVPRLLNFDLHNVSGFASGVLLLVSAITGVAIVALHIVLSPPAAEPQSYIPLPHLQSLVATADLAMPAGKISMLEFSPDRQSVTIRKKMPDQETGIFDLSTIEIATATGKVSSAHKVTAAPPLFKVILPIVALHYGTFGGVTTRILYVALGTIPTVLLVTGFLMWQQRQRRQIVNSQK